VSVYLLLFFFLYFYFIFVPVHKKLIEVQLEVVMHLMLFFGIYFISTSTWNLGRNKEIKFCLIKLGNIYNL